MVSPVNDPRYQLARLMRAQQGASAPVRPERPVLGPAPSKAAVQLGRATSQALIANPTLKDRIESIASGAKPAQQGAIGTILGNPLARGVLKGAELFALPGRAIQSTIGEVVDVLDGDPLTQGSISDWATRMKDPTTGFGKSARINTGNKWLDRTIGFVGDVALDPITYLTFGAGKFAGYAGRSQLAFKVLENTGDEALSAAVARRGRSALRGREDVLERVGANNFGVYMFGKRLKVGADGRGLRVPLSGHIGEIGEATLAKIRLGITDTRVGRYLQKVTMPKNMLEARLAVARGEASAAQAADYIRFFNVVPAQRAARGAALQAFEQELMALIKQEEGLGDLESYRKAIYRIIEDPEKLASATPAEQRAYGVWKNWLEGHRTRIEEGFRSVDPAAEITMVENYFPRVMTDDAMAYIRSDAPHAEKMRVVFMDDPFSLPDAFTPRSLRPGREFFGKVLEKEDLNIERLNQIARDAGFKGDFFETDVIQAAQKYIADAADEMGIIERNRILRDTGFFKRLEDARVTAMELDEEAVAAARSRVAEVDASLRGVDDAYRQAVADLVDNVRIAFRATGAEINATEDGIKAMERYLYTAREDIARLDEHVAAAKRRLEALFGNPDDIPTRTYGWVVGEGDFGQDLVERTARSVLSSDFPDTLLPVLEQFTSIQDEIARYVQVIDDAQQRIAAGYVSMADSGAIADELESAARIAMDNFREAQESIRLTLEMSNVLETTWSRILKGKAVGGETQAHLIMKEIREVLGLTPQKTKTGTARAVAGAIGAEGSLRRFVESSDFARILDDLGYGVGASDIKLSNVARMTEAEFMRRISLAFTDEIDLTQLREAGLYAIARDMHVHGSKTLDELPDALQVFLKDLRDSLEDALYLDTYRATQIKNGAALLQGRDLLERRLGGMYRTAVALQQDAEDYVFAADFFRRLPDEILDSEFEEVLIDGLSAAMKEAGNKRTPSYLYEYLDDPVGNIGIENPTLRDVVVALEARHRLVNDALDSGSFMFSVDQRLANLTQFAEGETTLSYRSVISAYEKEMDRINKKIRPVRVSKRVATRGLNENAARQGIAKNLMQYAAMSTATAQFEAVSAILARNGLVPGEDIWRGILRHANNTYGVQFRQKLSHIDDMEQAMSWMYRDYMTELAKAKRLVDEGRAEVASPSAVFQTVLTRALDDPDAGPLLREAIGPSMADMYDPYGLQVQRRALDKAVRDAKASGDSVALNDAKDALHRWERDVLIPWAKNTSPRTRGQAGAARKVLDSVVPAKQTRSRKSMFVYGSPLSPEATDRMVLDWFQKFFDRVQDVDIYKGTIGAATAPDVVNGRHRFKGLFSLMRDAYLDTSRFFNRMSDGYIDPARFLATGGEIGDTPFGFAALMSGHARRLQNIGGAREARAAARGLAVGEERSATAAAAAAERAARIEQAFLDDTLSPAELKALGFTKEMIAHRDTIFQHRRLMGTVQYAKALEDKQIIEFLKAVSHLDFSKFDDGIVVGTSRRGVNEAAQASVDTEAAKLKIAKLESRKTELQQTLDAERQKIIRGFQNAEGRFETETAKRQAEAAVREWRANEGSRFNKSFAEIDDEINRTNASLGMAVEGFEEVPIFATLPDGTKITFTSEEWESLYRPSLSALEAKTLRAERAELMKGWGSARMKARPRLKKIEARLVALEARAPRAAARGADIREQYIRATYQGSKTIRDEIILLQDEAVRLRALIDGPPPARVQEIDSILVIASQETRNSALEKARILVLGRQGQRGVDVNEWMGSSTTFSPDFSTTGYTRTHRYYASKPENQGLVGSLVSSSDAKVREEGLNTMWSRTSSYSVLEQEEELAETAVVRAYRSAEKDATMLARAARAAQERAIESRRDYTTVEKSIRDAIRGMRIEEIRAAKAAGAVFTDVSPQGARTYVLNGKTYTIPSWTQMVRNPDKYIKRSEKMSEMFYELQKRGGVAMWADMDEQARAVSAMWALHRTAKEAKIASNNYRLAVEGPTAETAAKVAELEGLVASWSSDLDTLSGAIRATREALDVERALAQDDYAAIAGDALEARIDFWNLGAELRALYGDVIDKPGFIGLLELKMDTLRKQHALFSKVLEDAPSPGDTRSLLSAKRPATRERWLQVHRDWLARQEYELRALGKLDLNSPGDSAVWDALMRASAAEARFVREQGRMANAQAALEAASTPRLVERVIKPFEEGYEKAAATYLREQGLKTADAFKMPSYGVNPEVTQMLSNLARIKDGAMARDLGRMVGQYTGFFKAYATLSPGFHARNAMSNIFQMWAAGADVGNIRRGLKLYRMLGEHIKNGGTLDSWMRTPQFLALSDAERSAARVAADVNLALGGGNVEDAFREFLTLKKSKLTHNKATRLSRGVGYRVEGSARFMLAFDTAIKGDDFTASFNRTKRFLFDYHDPTILDDTVRNIIPFWTWMSRNLPLQITNQWLNPKPYVIYLSFSRNFGIGPDVVVPQYMQEQGAIELGGDNYLTPDLPWTKLNEQIAELGQPRRLLSYVNPALRLPVELSGNVKFYNNQEFSGRYVPAGGKYTPFQPLLAAMGQLEHDSSGRALMSDKAQYAISSLIPTFGQAERLFPSTDYGDGAALARYVGIPLRKVNDEARDRELQKRLRALQAMQDKQRRIEEAG